MPRAQIKDEKTYGKLREHGESKEKSARIANAAANSSRRSVGSQGRPEPVVSGLVQGRPDQAGPRDRHQGPVIHDQGAARRRLAQALIAQALEAPPAA